MGGSKYVGHLSIQISGQNMKVVRPDGQIIQGPQLIQGPLDHCTACSPNFHESANVCWLEVRLKKIWPQECKTATKYCIGLEKKFGMDKLYTAMRGTPS